MLYRHWEAYLVVRRSFSCSYRLISVWVETPCCWAMACNSVTIFLAAVGIPKGASFRQRGEFFG